jgi:hypothetical protein
MALSTAVLPERGAGHEAMVTAATSSATVTIDRQREPRC